MVSGDMRDSREFGYSSEINWSHHDWSASVATSIVTALVTLLLRYGDHMTPRGRVSFSMRIHHSSGGACRQSQANNAAVLPVTQHALWMRDLLLVWIVKEMDCFPSFRNQNIIWTLRFKWAKWNYTALYCYTVIAAPSQWTAQGKHWFPEY